LCPEKDLCRLQPLTREVASMLGLGGKELELPNVEFVLVSRGGLEPPTG